MSLDLMLVHQSSELVLPSCNREVSAPTFGVPPPEFRSMEIYRSVDKGAHLVVGRNDGISQEEGCHHI
jgi:hypothetical protein